MKKALIFQGGWEGHEPELVSARLASILEENGYEVTVSDTLDILGNADYLMSLDLIVPCWTMGEISEEYCNNISNAVKYGVGLAGCHGGMCDTFRSNTEWHRMTGGQWIDNPGGDSVNYVVNIKQRSSQITEGLDDFVVTSEQYYLQYDPSIDVIASTMCPVSNFHRNNSRFVDMPVVWTKYWGCGRVFYSSLGHSDDVFYRSPNAQTIMERGMLWAGEGKEITLREFDKPKTF